MFVVLSRDLAYGVDGRGGMPSPAIAALSAKTASYGSVGDGRSARQRGGGGVS